jgi:hypothetical protein
MRSTVVSLRARGQVKSDLRLAEELWDEFNTYAERDSNSSGNGRRVDGTARSTEC